MTVKEILQSLSKEDQDRLNYAFEHGISQFTLLPDGRYIGVNTKGVKFLRPEITVGDWSIGTVPDAKPS